MTILIQDINNTMAGYQKEILPSSWSPKIVKYSVYNIVCLPKHRKVSEDTAVGCLSTAYLKKN